MDLESDYFVGPMIRLALLAATVAVPVGLIFWLMRGSRWSCRRRAAYAAAVGAATFLCVVLFAFGAIVGAWVCESVERQLRETPHECRARLGKVEQGWTAAQLADVLRDPVQLNDGNVHISEELYLSDLSGRIDWPPDGESPSEYLHGRAVIQVCGCNVVRSGTCHQTVYEFRLSADGTVVAIYEVKRSFELHRFD